MEDFATDSQTASTANDTQKRAEEFADAYERMARYLILTNGGGAVAASAFVGTTMKYGHGAYIEVLPILSFYVGVIAAGLYGIRRVNIAMDND
jgi:hypothetical protein